MSKDLNDYNKDINSEAEVARRRSFIERMERKLEFKKSVVNPRYQDQRQFLV